MKILSFLVINVFIATSNADSETLNSVNKILELTASANAIPLLEINKEWDRFLEIYKPQYKDSAEYGHRKKIFESNLQNIKKHNIEYDMGLHTYRKGINQFTDKTNQEKRQGPFGFIPWRNSEYISQNKPTMPFTNDRKIPASIDWRKRGAVTPVKNQKHCGSCWAFSAVGALEGQYFLATNRSMTLSEQQLVDCAKSSGGCIGGNTMKAYLDLKAMGGITTEHAYPYTANRHQKCKFKKKMAVANVIGYQKIAEDEKSLKLAVALYGPISVAIRPTYAFMEYNDGIYYDKKSSEKKKLVHHAVVVVGYGSENGTDYWIVKNSWGDQWGENGYIRMSRNRGNNCKIATFASCPKLKVRSHK